MARKKGEIKPKEPQKVAKTRTSKKTKVELSPELESPEQSAKCKIDWSDPDINFIMLNAIMADNDIKQGLYPVPGGSMTALKQGGKKKTAWQWKLAVEVFKDHPVYGVSFAETLDCADTKIAAKLQTT